MDIVEKLISLPSSVIYQQEEYHLSIINEGSKELRLFYAPEESWGVDETLVFFEALENREDLDWAIRKTMLNLLGLKVQVREIGSGRLVPIHDIPIEPSFFS